MPCDPCKKYQRTCKDQTEEAKSLVHPKHRGQRKKIEHPGTRIADPPCRKCYQTNRKCVVRGPAGTDCDACQLSTANGPRVQVCNWDLTGAKPQAKKQANTKRLTMAGGDPAVPYDQKCYRCATQGGACNGKYPCNNCQTKRLKNSCVNVNEGKEKKSQPKCTRCKNNLLHCDKNRPCGKCKNAKLNCSYLEQEGLVTRTYKVASATNISGMTKDALEEDESSSDECLRCEGEKRNCSGGQPCYRCVKDKLKNKRVGACNWRKRGGCVERYTLDAYTLDNEGNVVLKDDYQDTLRPAAARRPVRGEPPSKKAGQSSSKTWQNELLSSDSDADDEFDTRAQYMARTAPSNQVDVERRLCAEGLLTEQKSKRQKVAMLASSEKRLPEPATFNQAMKSDEASLWKQAINEEIASLEEKQTWDVVPAPKDAKPITSKFVFKRKYGPDGEVTRHKARLVARGFQQEEGIDYEETFAAVVKPSSYRILFALAAIFGWLAHQGDVKTAFLNSGLEKSVYMRAPQGMEIDAGFVLLVLRAIYGLKQSPRAWYRKFKQTMEGWGWRISAYDPCVFINDETGLILQLHVDDMITFGKNLAAILAFKEQVAKTFPTTDEGECSWYLGMHVDQKARRDLPPSKAVHRSNPNQIRLQ